jgi:acyl-CoA thioesterase I
VKRFASNTHISIATYLKQQRQQSAPLAGNSGLALLFSVLSLFVLLFLASCVPSAAGQGDEGHIVVQQPSRSRLTYVAIGASDTFGLGTDDPASQNWAADLAGKLGNGVHFINLGIPSIHLHDALNVELPVALDSHPDLVTVWLAVDDLADNVPLASYSHDLDLLISRLQTGAPHARIVVANVPDLTLVPRFQGTDPQTLHAQIAAYNNAIATIVKRHSVLLVDLYARWSELASHPEYISNDGFHPNAVGYTRIAEIFYQVLQEHKQ